ncbi:hypothetical protein RFI_37672, partial [Reticulomyxa filosa]
KITFIEIEKLKKDIELKDNQKQEMQVKETQIIQQKNKQMNNNKDEQKQNINDNSSSSIINTSSTFNFELVHFFKLIKTFTRRTNIVRSIDYSTFDDCQFICSGSDDHT